VFEELLSKDPKIKYPAAKALLGKAREDPGSLYPHARLFIELMDSDNSILKWTAIDIVGSLAAVDRDRSMAATTGKLASFLSGGKMITANHAIGAMAGFARAFPDRRGEITRQLIEVEDQTYDTDECRNIALGNVIVALDSYFASIEDKRAVLEFARRHITNSRNATARKMLAFLKKHGTQ
jgi:hypothetical protein